MFRPPAIGQYGRVRATRYVRTWLQRPIDERTLAVFVLYTLRWAFGLLLVLGAVGTAGFMTVADFSFIDALYMTVITLSTVGFGEVHPLTSDGRLFTIALIIASFATLVYAAAVMTNLFSTGEALQHLKRARGRRMRHALSDHIIIVGFGRVGQAVAHSARELGATCVVIDRSSEREADIEAEGHIALIGDATEEKDLTEAGIHRARALVASAELDQVNLIVTLTARAMRPDLHIVSRVNEPSWRERMMRAGADVAESPYITYGMSLATAAQSKILLDVHRLPLLGFGTEEFVITSNSKLIGRTVEEIGRRHPGIFVVGLRREDQFHRWHELSGAILHGDILVALGDSDALLGLNAAQ